ncbi:MAG: hypothetical protein LC723_07480 [Actinobacteria bacterium]|nr:hypothetical protein [Actinomycetota bacterium]
MKNDEAVEEINSLYGIVYRLKLVGDDEQLFFSSRARAVEYAAQRQLRINRDTWKRNAV